MKCNKIALAAALVLGLGAVGSAGAASNGGTIYFQGAVNDPTCTVSGGAGTDYGLGNFTVDLKTVSPSQFTAAGDVQNKTPFEVVIGGPGQGSCTDGKVATFSLVTVGTPVDPISGALENTLNGEATGVAVQLLDGSNKTINLNSSYSVNSPAIANNTATIPFSAQFLSTNATVTPGLVNAHVLYGVTYN
ncbi:fimbrial protein [Dyella nitratireducens]|uniref:Fimbrial protein n=1 Tax=Dyella nitratireducens TaxID=1849580 RepID=A0ABQ1G0Y2_9GAMM|nr:fimbrial protein [Dyella nitratireducens]GGA34514.1 fimbrial protein [Dyella nitratireducens]GLQ40876.1 fimbrial protein [Dyella nitratireducens]